MIKVVHNCFLILIISLTSCQQREVKKEFYPNGKLQSEVEFTNGVRNGFAKYYNEDGKIYEIQNYINDTLSGNRVAFYANGNIKGNIYYDRGTMNGPYKIFYEDGSIAESGEYINGLKRGLVEQFYKGNKLHKRFYVITFYDQKPHMWWSVEYDTLGNKIMENRDILIHTTKDTFESGEAVNVGFEMVADVTYDSGFVFVGGFDYQFNATGETDTIKLVNGRGSCTITPQTPGRYYIRGKWLLYTNRIERDTTYEYQTFDYFEQGLMVN